MYKAKERKGRAVQQNGQLDDAYNKNWFSLLKIHLLKILKLKYFWGSEVKKISLEIPFLV